MRDGGIADRRLPAGGKGRYLYVGLENKALEVTMADGIANRRSCLFSGRAGSIAIHRAHCGSAYVMALIASAAVGY
jgi:hypothetical protein